MESFQDLGLPEFLGHSLKQMNFSTPTPVQAQAIPPALQGKDVIASAQTGTGKTAAFGIPLLTFLANHPDKTALILTPTRELAVQVMEVLRKLTGHHHLGGSVLLIGGANMNSQLNLLSRKPRLVIGTPGRVIDHLNRKTLSLAQTGFMVLDEADRMLDMGFAPQLEEIRKRISPQRQTLLFSATIPHNIQEMGSRYLKDPVRISVGETTQPVTKIAQMVIHTTEANKPEELVGELNDRKGSILVFARTQNRVDRIMDRLKEKGFKVTRIHGGRSQSQRRQAIEQFRDGHYRMLIATDIAARGLDIHHIAHVINYDLPRNPEDYIHRVGRTARAGAEGSSLCFLTKEDRELWERILRLMKVTKDSIQSKPSRFGDFTPKAISPAHPSHRPPVKNSHMRGDTHNRKPGFQKGRHFEKSFSNRPYSSEKRSGPSERTSHAAHGKDRFQSENASNRGTGFQKHNPRPIETGSKGFGHFQKDRFRKTNTSGTNFIYHGPEDQQPYHSSGTGRGSREHKPDGFLNQLKARFSGKNNTNDSKSSFSASTERRHQQPYRGTHKPNRFTKTDNSHGKFKNPRFGQKPSDGPERNGNV